MEACKMCWKTKEISPVFSAYPRAVSFCKGCAFDIHRVVNALAYALDTSGFGFALVARNLILLDLQKLGTDYVDLRTGELVGEPTLSIVKEGPLQGKVVEGIEKGGQGGKVREGDNPKSPEMPQGSTESQEKNSGSSRSPKS